MNREKKKELLLVVDVQNGFVSDATRHVVPRLARLLKAKMFQSVVFTKFINEDSSPYERFLDWRELKAAKEQMIVDELRGFADRVITKPTYTAADSRLIELIKKEGYDAVAIAGIDTDCCVMMTAVDLFQRGIRPVVLAEFCASNGGPASHQAALEVLRRCIGERQIRKDVRIDGTYGSDDSRN